MLELFSYSLSYSDLALLLFAATLIGMGKTGLHGAGMLAVPMMALVFGAKESTGIVLIILIFADLFAVRYYNRHAQWQQLRKLLPYAFLGVVIGTLLGDAINDVLFTQIMALTILICVGLMIWQQRRTEPKVPSSAWFVICIGILGGIATMVGNLAGPVMALYFLALQFSKNKFLGTAAWFFLCINVFKVPFHVFSWHTIQWNSFFLSAMLLPAIAVGAYLGVRLIKHVPEKPFRWLIISMTLFAAIMLLI